MARLTKAHISKALPHSPAFPGVRPVPGTLDKHSHCDQNEAIFSSVNDGKEGVSCSIRKSCLGSQKATVESAAIVFLLGMEGTEVTAKDRPFGELMGKNTHTLFFS